MQSATNSGSVIRLGFVGMVPENGHPFSWGGIINGAYNTNIIERYGYPGINDYLDRVPADQLGLPGVAVTHLWCDRPEDTQMVAASAGIPHVLQQAEEMVGQVDAVVIPTDLGEEHWERARPFLDAGLPVFIDKPLTDNLPDLERFIAARQEGATIMSSSCMRYAKEFQELKNRLPEVGELRLVTVTCAKSWERYGIHALESIYGLFEPDGWTSVRNVGTPERNLVIAAHDSGVDAMLALVKDLTGAFCHVEVYGTQGHISAQFQDTYAAFRAQLVAFIDFLKGDASFNAFDETVEQMRIIAAGIESRNRGGETISLR